MIGYKQAENSLLALLLDHLHHRRGQEPARDQALLEPSHVAHTRVTVHRRRLLHGILEHDVIVASSRGGGFSASDEVDGGGASASEDGEKAANVLCKKRKGSVKHA